MKNSSQQAYFTQELLTWNANENNRQMPWKGEKNPYKIWLSEIILQQTRVDQGLEYYNRFIKKFPTVKTLANAEETVVFKLWEGLGYYTRCKNLIATAKYISTELGGIFPDRYEDILSLKGVGPYTAAAISSFAFNLPHAVLDGNVLRVLSRYFGNATPIDSTEGKKLFTTLADRLLDRKEPGIYNQCLMDFGATICKPQLPLCINCPLQQNCVAYKKNEVGLLPVKVKSITKKNRWFYYLVVSYKNKVYVTKRGPKDIWENLHEFILIESNAALLLENLHQLPAISSIFGNVNFEVNSISSLQTQKLTHQTIYGQFIQITISKPLDIKGYEKVSKDALANLPFPKFISSYLKEKNVSLNLF